jgi:hypothetical protein
LPRAPCPALRTTRHPTAATAAGHLEHPTLTPISPTADASAGGEMTQALNALLTDTARGWSSPVSLPAASLGRGRLQ